MANRADPGRPAPGIGIVMLDTIHRRGQDGGAMASAIQRLQISGSSSEIGHALGRALSPAIHEYVNRRIRRLQQLDPARDWLTLAEASLVLVKAHAFESHAELVALAGAAGMDLRHVYLAGGLTDALDFVNVPATEDRGNCSSVLGRSTDPVLAQTWDMPSDAPPFVVLLDKRYSNGPRVLTLTTCLGLAHLGLSDAGLGVGTNNLGHPRPRPGLHFSVILNEMLQRPDLATALDNLERLPRMSAHAYGAVSSQTGVFVEATPEAMTRHPLDGEHALLHTNHFLHQAHQGQETWPSPTSVDRLQRAQTYWAKATPPSDEALKAFLALPGISRPPHEDVATIAGVIVRPASLRMSVCSGPTAGGHWVDYRLGNG